MDGWITIGTKLDTDKFDRQVADLENKIKAEEEKQSINIQATSQLEEEQAQITREVEELTREYEKAANEAERLRNIINSTNTGSYQNYMATREYDVQAQKVDEINKKLEEATAKQGKMNEKIAKSNLQYQTSVDKVSALNGKIEQIAAKKRELDLKEQQAQLKLVEKNVGNIQKGIAGTIAKIGKMALAVFGVRTAFNMLRQASSTLAQYNQQYATDLEYIRFVIAQGIAPILEKVVMLTQTLMAYINYLAQRLFGVNLFAKGSADAFKKAKDNMSGMAKSSKEIKNNLAGFDELNVLDNSAGANGAGAGALAPSLDIGGLEDVEIPEWLQKIGDFLEPIRTFREQVVENFNGMYDGIKRLSNDFWSFISPFFKTIRDYILPILTGLAGQIIKTLGTLLSTVGSLFTSIWNGGIRPTLNLLLKIWDDVWSSIKDAWDKWGQPIFDNLRTAIEKIGEILQALWDNIIQPVWQNLLNVLTELWSNHLKPLWDNILDFFGELINGVLEIWNKTLAPFLTFLIDTFGPPIADLINALVKIIGNVLGAVVDVVNGVVTSLKGIIEFIVGVFTGDWQKAWQGIQDFFGGIWDGIVAIVKGAINLVIDLINGMLGGLENALNWIVDKINELEITNPFTGEEIWSPHVDRFNFGRIPRLARGGIVSTPTRAVIGEAGREAILPLENNTEWMDMLAEKLNGANNNITIRFTGSTAQLVRMLKPELEKEDKRTGKRLIVGGAY